MAYVKKMRITSTLSEPIVVCDCNREICYPDVTNIEDYRYCPRCGKEIDWDSIRKEVED